MGLIGDFLDLLGLGGISGVDYLFAAMAIIGTFLFLVYFALILIGGAADGALGAVGFDVDFDMGAEGVFHMLTLQGLLSFMMMFGISRSSEFHDDVWNLRLGRDTIRWPPNHGNSFWNHCWNVIHVVNRKGVPTHEGA